MTTCPKCHAESGDDWSQCQGSCPMVGSPHYSDAAMVLTPASALAEIQDLLDGTIWDSGTIERVAEIMRRAGFEIRDPADVEDEEEIPY